MSLLMAFGAVENVLPSLKIIKLVLWGVLGKMEGGGRGQKRKLATASVHDH